MWDSREGLSYIGSRYGKEFLPCVKRVEKAVLLQRSAASSLKGAPQERHLEEAVSLKGPSGPLASAWALWKRANFKVRLHYM